MRRTEITYSQLDRVLRSLGFTCRLLKEDSPALLYEHKETGAVVMMPPLPETDFVLDYHLVGARTTVELFGIADGKTFDAQLRNAAEVFS